MTEKFSDANASEGVSGVSDAGPIPPAANRRTRPGRVTVSEDEVLCLVEELGLASVNQVHQRLIEGGKRSITYLAVGAVLRELAKQGRLAVERDGHRLLYPLPMADDAPTAPYPCLILILLPEAAAAAQRGRAAHPAR